MAKRLAEKGQKAKLKGIMNLAGGTMHPENVPERLQGQYKAVYENAEGVPIVDRHVMDVFNGESHLFLFAIWGEGEEWRWPG